MIFLPLLAVLIFGLVILSNYLHAVAGWSVVDHSAGVAVQDLIVNGTGIGTENEVNARPSVPTLIGVWAIEYAAVDSANCRFQFGNWRSDDGIYVTPRQSLYIGGELNPYRYVGRPIPLILEDSVTVTYESEANNDHAWGLLYSYEPVIAPRGGPMTSRNVSFTAADFSTTGAFGTAVTITNLDSSKVYRLAGYIGGGATDTGLVRITCPDFEGKALVLPTGEATCLEMWFPYDSLLVRGTSTISVSGSGGAASAMEASIFFEEWAVNDTKVRLENCAPLDASLETGGTAAIAEASKSRRKAVTQQRTTGQAGQLSSSTLKKLGQRVQGLF